MDRHGKSGSFIGRHRWRTTMDSPRSSFSSPKLPRKSSPVPADISDSNDDLDESVPDVDHDQILAEIDRFADELSTADDKATPPEVPDVIGMLSLIIKSKTRKSTSVMDEDPFLYESVRLLWKLKTVLGEFPSTSMADRINKLLHRIVVFMEEELRGLLLHSKAKLPPEPKSKVTRHISFKTERSPPPAAEEPEEDFPGFSEEKLVRITKMVTTIISVGYKNECSHVYSMARGNALYEQLKKHDFEKLNAEDVPRLNWESLEPEIARWIHIIKHCSDVLIPAERKLGDTVFGDHVAVFRGLFTNLVRSVITSLLDYAGAVAKTKQQTAERLFRFLDVYEALDSLRDDECNDLHTELSSHKDRIGAAVVNMFGDLENSIQNDAAKTPVPGGAVHPLTRYVMNYVKYACDYGDTIQEIFQQKAKPPEPEDMVDKSPLAAQMMSVMGVLDVNLALKSTLYKDPSLRFVFLMNNGRYILTKVKESNEIKKMMGDNWCRRKSSEVRLYHKSYQRETWTRLLQCLAQEGIQANGKVNKQVLKERFKNFNAMFDEIHKTQSTWVVREEQLMSEMRASISALVIPAYRSFVGRYKHHLEAGKSLDKYIKYQPEDIEALIETLFDGYNNNASMSRKRF